MKQAPLAIAAITTLALTSCSSSTGTEQTSATVTAVQPASTTEPLNLGEMFTITRCGGDQPCEVNVKFANITLTETCPDGVNYPDMEAMDKAESIYLTVEGEYEVVQSPTNYSISETDFDTTTSDKVSKEPSVAYDCKSPDVEESLDNPVDPGMKRVGRLTMSIDPNVKTLRFAPMWEPISREFDLSTLLVEAGSGERPAGGAGQAPRIEAPAQVQDVPVEATNSQSAQPGECVGPAAICGYGTDENGTPNPSSSEIQSWWVNCISANGEEYCRENDPYQ